MSDISKMTGTPWHVEILKKDTEDKRRHKVHCKYYNDGMCIYKTTTCMGSAHCEIYKDLNDNSLLNNNQNPNNEKPYYVDANYMRHLRNLKNKKNKKRRHY